MLLKCSECGFDNQLGAIFCRECGAKLDVETMRPEVKEHKEKINYGDLARNLLAIAVLGGIAFAIGMMFYPEKSAPADLDATAITATNEKFQALINTIGGEQEEATYVFSPDEVTYLYNNKLTNSEEGEGYSIEKMYFSVDPYDNVVLLADAKLFGANVSFKLVGKIVDDKAELEIVSAKMGHLTIPGFAMDKIVNKFTPCIDEDGSIKDILAATEKLVIDEDGNFSITVKEMKK